MQGGGDGAEGKTGAGRSNPSSEGWGVQKEFLFHHVIVNLGVPRLGLAGRGTHMVVTPRPRVLSSHGTAML